LEQYCYVNKGAHPQKVNGIAVLFDGEDEDYSHMSYFATGGGDSNINIRSLQTHELVRSFSNNHKSIFGLEYLSKNRLISTANEVKLKQFHIYVWNWKSGQLLLSLKDHYSRISRIIVLDKDMFVSCDRASITKIWQIED